MSYCRFQNTVQDLNDCKQNIFDNELSRDEKKARRRLIEICVEIIELAGGSIEESNEELIECVENYYGGSDEETE